MQSNKDNERIKEMELTICKIYASCKENIELSIVCGTDKLILKYLNEKGDDVIETNEKMQIAQIGSNLSLLFEIIIPQDNILVKSTYDLKHIAFNEINKSQLSKDFAIEFILADNSKLLTEMKPISHSSLTRLQSEEVTGELAEDLCQSFCECFFIASLPEKNAQMIQNSNAFTSHCKHKICTSFPAYQPEITTRYPFEDKNNKQFALNDLIASLCFPFGIKVCFGQSDSVIPEQKSFMTVTTNELGKRNYIYVYPSFLKVDFLEFKSKYDCDPIKDYLLKAKIVQLIDNCQDKKEFQDQIQADFELSQMLVDSTYVYIPVSYCLVSKFPYEQQMKSCIESLIQLKEEKEQKMFLKHLIYEIPIPNYDSRVYFYIPYHANSVEIYGKNFQGLFSPPNSMSLLFDYFSNEALVKIFTLLLFEQKILLVSNDYKLLTQLSLSLLNIIYPLRWKYNYIPVICYNILKILQAFVPFMMGISQDLFPHAKVYFDDDSNIFIIHLKEKKKSIIRTSQSYAKSKHKIALFDKELPNEIKHELMTNLETTRKEIKYPLKESKGEHVSSNLWSTDKKIRKCFMKCLCMLFGSYKRYVSIIDNESYFNIEEFVQEKADNKQLYIDLVSTGLFHSFIQSNNNLNYFNKYSMRYCACPFKPIIKKGKTLQFTDKVMTEYNLRKTKINLTFSDSDSSTLNASNTSNNKKSINYLIVPYFLHPLVNSNEIQDALIQKYKLEEDNTANTKNGNGILIINSSPHFTKDKEEYNHHRYIIPTRSSTSKPHKSTKKLTVNIFDEKIIKLEDTMKALLTSNRKLCKEPVSDRDFISPEIRHAFSEMIYQNKFNQSNSHALDNKSFSELSHLVFSALIYGIKDYYEGRLITKSLFYYYKRTSQKQKFFLYQVFERKKPFDIWVDEQFWYEWFTIENKQREANEDNAFMTITEIASIMNDLNIEINFQLYCLNEKIASQCIKDDGLIKALEVTMIKQFNYRKQVQAS